MLDGVLVRKIDNLNNPEKEIDFREINLYSKLIHKKPKDDNDNNEIAKDLFDQLIDNNDDHS